MNTRKNKEEISAKRLSALTKVLAGGALLTVLLQGVFSETIQPGRNNHSSQGATVISATQVEVSPFERISIEARAAYVLDVKTGAVLFARNEEETLPLASITKLMTALVAREHASESVVITLNRDDLSSDGDSGLRPGERWRTGDLLNLMLLVSSNDAAHAVAGFIGGYNLLESQQNIRIGSSDAVSRFVAMMNEKAAALGLAKMQFFNETGLDMDATRNGGYGSARDVAILFLELWNKYPETVAVTSQNTANIISQDSLTHFLLNTNEITGRIPGMIASKTGFTDIAGGNLAVIFDRGVGDPVVVVVLGSTYKGRFDDVSKLAGATRKTDL